MHLVALLPLHAAVAFATVAFATAENEILAPYLTEEDFANAHRMAKSPSNTTIDDSAMYGNHYEGDMLENKKIVNSDGKFRNALVHENSKWPNARVPYVLAPGHHSDSERAIIAQGMEEIMSKTCIKFVKKEPSDRDAIMIFKGRGCFSNVGHVGGEQQLSLGNGCVYMGIAAHELMHALGFFHEQSRTDRDEFIGVHFENIEGWAKSNFESYGKDLIDDLGTQYDYGSIMHYPKTAFSTNGQPTIVPRQESVEIGQRRGLSKNDAYKINKHYGCDGTGKPEKPEKPSGSKCKLDKYEDWCQEVKERGYCNTAKYAQYCETSCNYNC